MHHHNSPPAMSRTALAAAASAVRRQCPKCCRKSSLIRFANDTGTGARCRWNNCDYVDAVHRDTGDRSTTSLMPTVRWEQVLPGCVIVYRSSGAKITRTMRVTECHDTGNDEVKSVYGVLISARDGTPLGRSLNRSRHRPGERHEILHLSMVSSITPATAKAAAS